MARWAVAAIGLSILAGIFARWFVFHQDVVTNPYTRHHVTELAFTGSFGLVVLLVGGLLARGYFQLPADAPLRIATRSLTGFLGFGVVVTLLLLVNEALSADVLTYYVLFAASLGSTVGMLFGIQEAYSVRNAREAERKDEAVRRIERERGRLEYLNHVIRHEVLNNVSVIQGYADLALEGPEDERPDEDLEVIRNQSREMESVIQDVRTLIESLQVPTEDALGPVDLSEVLYGEVADVRVIDADVTVTADVPEGLSVVADPLLARVFGNLLSNAVEHNDAADPRVDVIAERTPDDVVVHVVDNGPGVPGSKRDTLFERSGRGDHGLGLYIVSTILARYDGTVALTETGDDGSVFTVRLPRSPDDGDGAPTVSEHDDAAVPSPDPPHPARMEHAG